ncbi:MAG: hypothetical protein FD148_336 [Methylocystaceae bacterium]|nr:MAG: hypothetical protein FD148_336 [Methylocystaceae bacterium]
MIFPAISGGAAGKSRMCGKCTKSSEMRNGRSCVWIATRPFWLGLTRWVFC